MGEEKKKRVRYRSPERQLQDALNKAEQFANDGALADKRFIADKRLLAQRIKTLTILTARVRRDEMKKLKAELAAKDAEIERLKAENARLTSDLAARPKPAASSSLTAIEETLAKFNAKKGGQNDTNHA